MNPDFKELLLAFNAHGVEYLVVGAHALAVYGHVRATKDLDVWVRADPENAQRVLTALSAFGVPLGDLNTDDLSKAGTVFQIGIPPLRIDLITAIDGVDFSEAWPDRFSTNFGGGTCLCNFSPPPNHQQEDSGAAAGSRRCRAVGNRGLPLTSRNGCSFSLLLAAYCPLLLRTECSPDSRQSASARENTSGGLILITFWNGPSVLSRMPRSFIRSTI